jgi:hypothetical protein
MPINQPVYEPINQPARAHQGHRTDLAARGLDGAVGE